MEKLLAENFMSRGNQETTLIGIASLLMLTNLFAKPLGIPDPWGFVPMVVAFFCFFLVFRLQKKRKAESLGKTVPVAPLAKRKQIFWLVSASLIFGSVAMLPLLPYTVENFHAWIYYYLVPAQIVFIALILPWYWKKLVKGDAAKLEKEQK